MNRMDLNLVSSEFTKNTFKTIQLTQNNKQGQPVKQFKLEKPIEVLLVPVLFVFDSPLPIKGRPFDLFKA